MHDCVVDCRYILCLHCRKISVEISTPSVLYLKTIKINVKAKCQHQMPIPTRKLSEVSLSNTSKVRPKSRGFVGASAPLLPAEKQTLNNAASHFSIVKSHTLEPVSAYKVVDVIYFTRIYGFIFHLKLQTGILLQDAAKVRSCYLDNGKKLWSGCKWGYCFLLQLQAKRLWAGINSDFHDRTFRISSSTLVSNKANEINAGRSICNTHKYSIIIVSVAFLHSHFHKKCHIKSQKKGTYTPH